MNMEELIKIKLLNNDAIVPTYGSRNAAGADLYTNIKEKVIVKPNETYFFPTGIAFEMPEGMMGLLFARSGLGCKHGLAPANKVGVIDSDYRGEIIVALHNHSKKEEEINPGDRIAQIVFMPYIKGIFEINDELNTTIRGNGGFGSTGNK